MPVEIHELVVRVVLEENKSQTSIEANDLLKLKETIVKECTEKVLSKLESISER